MTLWKKVNLPCVDRPFFTPLEIQEFKKCLTISTRIFSLLC